MYQIFLFSSSNIFSSTEGILTFHLITKIFIGAFSPILNIFKSTLVPAGHFIFATALYSDNSANFTPFASIITSSFITQYF